MSIVNTSKQLKPGSIPRRNFIRQAVSLGLLGFSETSFTKWPAEKNKNKQLYNPLPPQGNYLIKNAYIITLDPTLGDIPNGDIHVIDGVIKEVADSIIDKDATVIGGEGMIVLPGFIETHWHLWTSLLRSMAGNQPGSGYFDVTRQYGQRFLPDDMYHATKLATTEAIYSGITTLHDWSHNVRSLHHAEASLKALGESGIRARYSFGAASGQDGDKPVDLTILEQLLHNWGTYSPESLLSLGVAWRGIGTGPGTDSKFKTGIKELERIRAINLPVSVHASTPGVIGKLSDSGLLGKDMQIVHGMGATRKEIQRMVEAGASISISPFSELRIGYGIPPLPEFIEANALVSLSVDTTTLTGNADMFAIMKIFLNLVNALKKDEFGISSREVLKLATIEGAKSLGIETITGSLSPGKRADIIMIGTSAPNLGFITNPVDLVVEAAQPSNIDTVMVDGRLLKHKGVLTNIQEDRVLKEADSALKALLKRKN